MARSTQYFWALVIAVVTTLGLGGCLEGVNKGSSRAPRMTKIVFKDSGYARLVGDTTAAAVRIPAGDSAYCSPTDLNYTPSDTTLRAGARIYYPITSPQPTQCVETTQPVPVGIRAD